MKHNYSHLTVFLTCILIFFYSNNSPAQCIPSGMVNWNDFGITNFTIAGDGGSSINHNTGIKELYQDYSSSQSINVTAGNSYMFSATNGKETWGTLKMRFWIDYAGNGTYTQVYDSGGYVNNGTGSQIFNGSILIDPSASGSIILRVAASYCSNCGPPDAGVMSTDACNFIYRAEIADYTLNISGSGGIMEISGNSNVISSGSTTVDITHNTEFGTYDINSIPLEKDFVITNNNSTALTLTLPIANPSSEFTISDQPDNAVIAPGNSETFTVAFNPSAEVSYSTTVSVTSNDATSPNYTFNVEGEGDQTFPDTDGDGVPDNIDGDDDNDGIIDSEEQLLCINSPTRKTTDVIFLNEDFGAGTTRETISGAAYCFENGTGSCGGSINLNDGSYVSYYRASDGDNPPNNETPNGEVASWADSVWYPGLDHTPGDTNGRMAMFNADNTAGIVFYETTITGVTAGVDVTYGFSIINLDRADLPGVGSRTKPSVLIEIIDPNNMLITSVSSGDIDPTANYVTGDWFDVSATFNTTFSQFTVRLTNEKVGGSGNDLAIDDIFVLQTLCDIDEDGVADSVDLDNDDDGIPNVVELGFPDLDKDGTLFGTGWVDSNTNGVHDSYETPPTTLRDSDSDGIPDYLDPDSDNDGIFDVVEYDGKGDVDIDGDGVGDGNDSEDFISIINNNDVDGDGILPIIDNNDDDGDGNDFGTNYADPLDDDGDGIPNYRDVDSDDSPNDFSNGSDIDKTEIYAHLDANNDGVLDDTVDTDGDGILDVFDTDNTVFGSPRELDSSYTLFFDGRNDYAEEASVINGWTDATIMAWVKIEPGSSGKRVIVGQDEIQLFITAGGYISTVANGSTLTSATTLDEAIWIHVAAIYDGTNGAFTLYLNGEEDNTTVISGALPLDTSSFTLGRTPDTDSDYFEGEIDEVRVFTKALTKLELQRMIYQELTSVALAERGATIPIDISGALAGTLSRYYKMDVFTGDITGNGTTGAKLYNIKDIYFQTAPLPYETSADGSWDTKATWLHGDVWDIDDEINNKDWSIIHIKHNITTSNRHGTSGLIIDSGAELEINNDVELQNSWYLSLDGKIDLEGESQLVQTEESVLDAASAGSLERDQQGNSNTYLYNYWCSPVGVINNTTNNNSYTLPDVISNVGFLTAGLNGTTSPVANADHWIWKYANRIGDTYSEWQHVRSTNSLLTGEGFTMKGPGTATLDQNYVFVGKPNNGNITALNITSGNDYLIGNPYPSALDADEFILDNIGLIDGGRNISGNVINGALYFWDHFANNTHNLAEYEGGYATYTLMGGVEAISNDVRINNSGAVGTKKPERYIPVGQGFFVSAIDDSVSGISQAIVGGDIVIKNSQRIFKTETTDPSLFLKSSNNKSKSSTIKETIDEREKMRLMFNSPNGYHRPLLVGVDSRASKAYDLGFDALLNETNKEDMYWALDDAQLLIQAIDSFDETQILPLSVKTENGGIIEINIEALENVPNATEIYLRDNESSTLHNLRNSKFITTVLKGIVDNRFEIIFSSGNQLSNSEFSIDEQIAVFYDSPNGSLVILNPNNSNIKTLNLVNTLGQLVLERTINSSEDRIEISANIATGIYISKMKLSNIEVSKKLIINN